MKKSLLWRSEKEFLKEEKKTIYLDNAATTHPKPECVYKAMDIGNRCLSVNAGRGSYSLAQMAVEGMDSLRRELLQFVNGDNLAEVVFASSATMALNQIIGGRMLSREDTVYVSPFVHNAVMRTLWTQKQKCGFLIEEIPLDVDKGQVDLEKTEYKFRENPPDYVFLSHVSNVTGYILPVEEIYRMTKEITDGKACVILDAAQSFGLLELDYVKTPFDAIVFAGHKTLYGPFGIAGFIKKESFTLEPYFSGGTGSDSLSLAMPRAFPASFEPGSPNLPAIAGLYASVQFIKETGQKQIFEHEQMLRDILIHELSAIEDVILYLPQNLEQHAGIVSFSVKGYRAEEIGMILDEDYHIAVRTGYHCAPLIHHYLGDEEYGGTVRVSPGWFNTVEEVQALAGAVGEIVEGE